MLPISVSATNCFNGDRTHSFQVPSRYRSIPAGLLAILRDSYFGHTNTNDFLANAFWSGGTNRCQWPQTFWEALDNLNLNGLYTLASIYHRSKDLDVWWLISKIKNIWLGTSYGFNFDAYTPNLSTLENSIRNNSRFCRDVEYISKKYHSGQICWREIPEYGNRGLHICFGNGQSTTVHIDYNAPAIGRFPLSVTCAYNPIAVAKHYDDLNSEAPKTIFDFLEAERQELIRLKGRSGQNCGGYLEVLNAASLQDMIDSLSHENLIKIAMKGSGSSSAGMKLLRTIQNRRSQLFTISGCSCN